ncbi:MAG: hypothetical protein Q9218_001551, partial [Villophora microphyllina]
RLPDQESLISGLEYEVLFFAHPGEDGKKKRPGWQWYVQTYQLLSRVLRKRLKRLWIVGAEKWIRVLVEGVIVVGGGKGRRKVAFVRGMRELAGWGVRLEEVCVPPHVWEVEEKQWRKSLNEDAKGWRMAFGVREPMPGSQSGVVRLPRVLREATSFLLMDECVKTTGIFRVNAKAVDVEVLKDLYERGQQFVVWKERDTSLTFPHWTQGTGDVSVGELEEKDGFDVHAAAGLIKLWYKALREPICPPSCYQALEKFYGAQSTGLEPEQLVDLLKPDAVWTFLSTTARQILCLHLLPLLSRVLTFNDWNQMSAYSLAVCFAPALVRGPDIEEDMKMTEIVRKLLEVMVKDWEAHLAPALGLTSEGFDGALRIPESAVDREDPLEGGDQMAGSLDAQTSGIALIDNDAITSDSPENGDEDNIDPPPLPPRPRTFSVPGIGEHRPPLPPRLRSSTVADMPGSNATSSPMPSVNDGNDSQVRRKPAPEVLPLPRYSMIAGASSSGQQVPATLEHIPFYNSVEAPTEDSECVVPGLPDYEALVESSNRTTIPRKPGSFHHRNLPEFLRAGFWITRDDGLRLCVRTDIKSLAGLGFQYETVENALWRLISGSKLWSQLSLRTNRVDLPSAHHSLNLTFAVMSTESLISSSRGAKPIFGITANVHDIRPPSGVPVGFIDSIELNFRFVPVLVLSQLSQSLDIKRLKHVVPRRSRRLRQKNDKTNSDVVDVPVLRPLRSIDEGDNDTDRLSQPSNLETQGGVSDVLDRSDDNSACSNPPENKIQPSLPSASAKSTGVDIRAPVASPPPTLRHGPLALLELIDISFRHIVSGTTRGPKSAKITSTVSGIKLARTTLHTSLADVAPALFRTGYMEAISRRAPLISRIASSVFNICSRSRNPSHPPVPNRDLQVQLWHLLQKHEWPTTELEPLSQEDFLLFTIHDRAPGLVLFDSHHESNGNICRLVKEEDVKRDGNEDMLDASFPMPFGTLNTQMIEDENLFSSFESTPLSLQSTTDHVMMLDDDDQAEEEMLLGDDDKQTLEQHLRLDSPCGDEREGAEQMSRKSYLEEEGDLEMLF